MERMKTLDREIHLLTGHMGAGKSYYFEYLSNLPEYKGPRTFKTSKDRICWLYFKGRVPGEAPDDQDGYLAVFNVMVPKDRYYGSELIRVETERAILINRVHKVLLDLGMGRKEHQRPFVRMVHKVENYIGAIDTALAKRAGMLPPDPLPKVNLRVLFFFCNFETLVRRIGNRWEGSTAENKLPTPLIESMLGYNSSAVYRFLGVDTSDESPTATERRKEEISEFLAGRGPSEEVIAERARQVRNTINSHKRKIRKFLETGSL